MRIGVVGVNHKSCELQLREIVAKGAAQLEREGMVLLSTCNRTEIYFSGESLAEVHGEILSHLREYVKEPFEHALYSYFGEDCFTHLALVTAGLDSLVLAESEIQGQVKVSYERSLFTRTLSKEIHFLFQKSFTIAKKIRTLFPQLKSETSLEGAVFHLVKAFAFENLKVLFVGNSQVNRQMISYFQKKGMRNLFLSTRGGSVELPLVSLERWQEFDLVVCGAQRGEYLIHGDEVMPPYKTRLIIDLGVPRNVDPQLRLHPHITLFNIEEIGHLIKKKEEDLCDVIGAVRKDVQKYLLRFQQREVCTRWVG